MIIFLAFIFLIVAITLVVILVLGEHLMSKTAELTAAVDKAVQLIQNPPVPQNVTPDDEVQAQADRLNTATTAATPTT